MLPLCFFFAFSLSRLFFKSLDRNLLSYYYKFRWYCMSDFFCSRCTVFEIFQLTRNAFDKHSYFHDHHNTGGMSSKLWLISERRWTSRYAKCMGHYKYWNIFLTISPSVCRLLVYVLTKLAYNLVLNCWLEFLIYVSPNLVFPVCYSISCHCVVVFRIGVQVYFAVTSTY